MFELAAILILVTLSLLMVFDKRNPAASSQPSRRAGDAPARTSEPASRAEAARREAEAAARFEQDFIRRYREEVVGS